ncbi:MAG: CHAT domain-containing tetratricopeptide repeat protein [Pseudanabaenaceae cyanobacterium]
MADPLADKIGINVQGGTVNVQNLNIGIAERLAQSGDRVRILVVAANPLGSSPLKLDHEVKTIQEALKRARKRDNFVVEYRLAATPSELRRALLDVEPHVLHFSGHGAGDRGLLFVSDESASEIYRSEGGEVRSRSTSTNEIRFVPAQPLANLLQLCDEHLECVVLNACYSDVQGDAISANIPFTIGMRDVIGDNVAIKFSQGFYDAIGAGKGYEMAFKWGKVAIEFDLVDDQAAKILVLRRKGESIPIIEKPTTNVEASRTVTPEIISNDSNNFFSGLKKLFTPSLSANDYFNQALKKRHQGDNQGAIADYNEAIRLKPDFAEAYNNRANAKSDIGDNQGAIADYNEAIRLKPDFAEAYMGRGIAKYYLRDNQGAIADYNESIRLKNPELHLPYNNRGTAKEALGDKQGAIADYNEAIRLKPDYASAYYNRGLIKKERGEKQNALADFQKAAELYQQQGNTEWYNKSLDRIRKLGG